MRCVRSALNLPRWSTRPETVAGSRHQSADGPRQTRSAGGPGHVVNTLQRRAPVVVVAVGQDIEQGSGSKVWKEQPIRAVLTQLQGLVAGSTYRPGSTLPPDRP